MLNMQQSIERSELVQDIQAKLKRSQAVAVLGARQVGKTTLARQIASCWPEAVHIFDLEKTQDKQALSHTPELVLGACRGLVILDEIQRMPALFEILRPLCDDPDRKAVFLLLGSANWDLVKGVSESLAGRVLFVDVPGLALEEVGTSAQDSLWFRGGYPRAFCAGNEEEALEWLDAFRRTYLERDIPGFGSKVSPTALGRFWSMLAHYHGQTWNASKFSEALGMDSRTVTHYRDLLVGTFMIRVLPPWFENLGKRNVKSPKVYVRDTGILHLMLGLSNMRAVQSHPAYGASWEGFALEQILIAHGSQDAWFWGTQRGAELDLMIIKAGKRIGFEFKCTDAPSPTKSMHIALNDLKLENLYVVYPGIRSYPLHEKINALPLHMALEHV